MAMSAGARGCSEPRSPSWYWAGPGVATPRPPGTRCLAQLGPFPSRLSPAHQSPFSRWAGELHGAKTALAQTIMAARYRYPLVLVVRLARASNPEVTNGNLEWFAFINSTRNRPVKHVVLRRGVGIDDLGGTIQVGDRQRANGGPRRQVARSLDLILH